MGKTIHTPEQQALCALVRRAREDAGVTQRQLAERLGRPQSFVSKNESGERRLDLVELADICRALGISLRAFVEQFEAAIGEGKTVLKRRRRPK